MALPEFKPFRHGSVPERAKNAVVFVHGIYSSHETFDKMHLAFARDARFKGWDLMWFDYNFHQSIVDSGNQLAAHLEGDYHQSDNRVIVVGHSMGGLVGRLAVLTGKVPCVRKLFLLGTPNFGAIRSAKLGINALLALMVGRTLWGLYQNQRGVVDLTNVSGIFQKYFADHPEAKRNAAGVEYISVPGHFFNENQDPTKEGNWGEWKHRRNWFTYLNLSFEVLGSYRPLWKVGMEKPHDGIVEDVSNCLIPPKGKESAYTSEKFGEIQNPPASHVTYAHLAPYEAINLTHVTIHHDPKVIHLVCDLAAANHFDDWYKSPARDEVNWDEFVRKEVPGLARLDEKKDLLAKLTPEERMEGLSPQDRLAGLSPDERNVLLQHLQNQSTASRS